MASNRRTTLHHLLAPVAALLATLGFLVVSPGSAVALGFIFNQVVGVAGVVHPGDVNARVASYQIDSTNVFALGDTIHLKIEGVADPSTTNAAIGFAGVPSVSVTGPTGGAFGAGVTGDVAHDTPPSFTVALTSSAGAATVLGVKNELVITLTSSSTGTASDHYTFTVSNIEFNVGTAVPFGNVNLHAYTGDGTGSLATAVTIATVSKKVVQRLAGADRLATAVAISQAEFETAGTAGAVVLARADDYPDALVGTALAAARNAPLLFTSGGSLPATTTAEIQRVLSAGRSVYLLGGVSAIPAGVATSLSDLGYAVQRYAGADRYGTALAVAAAMGNPTTVFLATGSNFPDALAAGPAAARTGGIVLLTAGSSLPTSVAAYLTAHAGTVYAVGGPAIAADPSAVAIVGADRYATAFAVATRFFTAPPTVGIASGVGFADALAGGALVAHAGGPILLSDPNFLPAPTSTFLTSNKGAVTAAWLFGGASALSPAIDILTANALGQ